MPSKQKARRPNNRGARARRTNDSNEGVSFGAQLRGFLGRNVTAFLIAALAILALQDIFGNHGVLAMLRSQRQAAEIQKQIDDLDGENRRLQGRVKSLKSDPAAIERIAREEMGLARPGEYIFKIPPKPGDAPETPDSPASPNARPPKN